MKDCSPLRGGKSKNLFDGKYGNIIICLNVFESENKYTNKDYSTVEPVYSGHLRFLEKVSAIARCPLYRGFQYFAKKRGKKDTLMHNNVLNLINTVTGKRVHRGAGRLEIPMDYTFYGDARVVLLLVGKSIQFQENN